MRPLKVTTDETLRADLRASLHQQQLSRVTDLLLDLDVTDERARATYASKLAINICEPDAFDAGIVKAAEMLHQELGGTQPLRDCPLFDRAFALTLAMKVVTEALNVWKEVTPPAEVAQAVADLATHRAHLVAYGKANVLKFGGSHGQ